MADAPPPADGDAHGRGGGRGAKRVEKVIAAIQEVKNELTSEGVPKEYDPEG